MNAGPERNRSEAKVSEGVGSKGGGGGEGRGGGATLGGRVGTKVSPWSPSSNRTCGFAASGFPDRFTMWAIGELCAAYSRTRPRRRVRN